MPVLFSYTDIFNNDEMETVYLIESGPYHVVIARENEPGVMIRNSNAVGIAHAILSHFTEDQPK